MSIEVTDLKQEALDWINSVREEYNLEPLTELPRGKRGDTFTCVLAQAGRELGDNSCPGALASQKRERTHTPDERVILNFVRDSKVVTRPIPAGAIEFIRRFDRGEFPELEA